VVDIHTHILPHVDDGASSWEVAVAMCEMAAEDGIRHIVATPHANDEYPFERIEMEQALATLRTRVERKIEMSLGCDFHFSYENLQAAMQDPRRFTIGGGRYLLVEFSEYGVPPHTLEALRKFRELGVVPIVTHPERMMAFQRNPNLAVQMVQEGCLIQVTASAFTGRWGPVAESFSGWLLDQGLLHIIASDAHDLKDRPPILSKARGILEARVGPEKVVALVDANPRAVVEDRALTSS
jgi:protein-tyrosine phosphatase